MIKFLKGVCNKVKFYKKIQRPKKLSFFTLRTKIIQEIGGKKTPRTVVVIAVKFQDIDGICYQLRESRFGQEIKKINLDIAIPLQNKGEIPLKNFVPFISKLYNELSSQLIVKIEGLPYCLFPEADGMFSEYRIGEFVKKPDCRFCKFDSSCSGLPVSCSNEENLKLLKPYFLPEEIAIEISNFKDSPLDTFVVKKMIDDAKRMRVSIVRFVLLGFVVRKDIYELLKYAKDNKFQVRLDISRISINNFKEFARRISSLVDYVVIYINFYDIKAKKSREISSLKKMGIKTIRAVTIITQDNLRTLDKIYNFILRNDVDKWAINRNVYNKHFSKIEAKEYIDKVFAIKQDVVRKRYRLRIHMVYPIPFCCYDPIKINFISTGPKSAEGYERISIDFLGDVRPIYYFDKKVGSFRNIQNAWDDNFLKSIRDYTLLPYVCKKCFFLDKCKGGSRFCAFYTNGSYNLPDPLMDYETVKDYR